MGDNYTALIAENGRHAMARGVADLAASLPARVTGKGVDFTAFGEPCRIAADGMTLGGKPLQGAEGVVVSLYARHVTPEPLRLTPLRAYREFPGTTPYHGAFATHTERILVPRVGNIKDGVTRLKTVFGATDAPKEVGGDFSFLVHPFPKIALCYIFYEADEEFPPSATCLFSANANRFIPNDALADTGEYASKKILAVTAAGNAR